MMLKCHFVHYLKFPDCFRTRQMVTQALVELVFGLEETRREIVKYFKPADIKRMRLVSRHWWQVLEDPRYWQAFQIKLTAENCRAILTEKKISRKRIRKVLEFSTSPDKHQDTAALLSVITTMSLKTLNISIICNSEVEGSELTSVTESLRQLAQVISSLEEAEIVFQSREDLPQFAQNHMIGFILAFLLDCLVKQILDKESRLKRLDLLGLGLFDIARHRKNISSLIIHLKCEYAGIKIYTDLTDPLLLKILHKLNMIYHDSETAL